MSSVLWEIELEEIDEQLMGGKIEREDAIRRWMRMGLDLDDAQNWADSAEGLI